MALPSVSREGHLCHFFFSTTDIMPVVEKQKSQRDEEASQRSERSESCSHLSLKLPKSQNARQLLAGFCFPKWTLTDHPYGKRMTQACQRATAPSNDDGFREGHVM